MPSFNRVHAPINGSSFAGTPIWAGSFTTPTGFGEEARGFVRHLRRFGFALNAQSIDPPRRLLAEDLAPYEPELVQELLEAFETPLGAPATVVLHIVARADLPRITGAAHQIVRTMWETDRLHPNAVPGLNAMDEIWVPSQFNVESFRTAGVTVPLHVVGSGVDATLFRPGLKPLPVPGTRGTIFLSMFEWSFRKGWDVLLRAWSRVFRPSDDVTLVLHTYPRGRFSNDETIATDAESLFALALNNLGLERDAMAPVVVIGRHLSSQGIAHLMAGAHCYVAPSRGEGWGRPQLEAMATGLPVIATNWSGNLEFMNEANSLLLEIDGLVPVDERMDVGLYHGQRWAEPSVEHLVQLLRAAQSDETLRTRIGTQARRDVEERWSWEHVAGDAAARLLAISPPEPSSPSAPSLQNRAARRARPAKASARR